MDRWDIITAAGCVLVVIGISFVFWPAALMVAGGGLIASGILGARAQADALARAKKAEQEAGTTE
jgi:hypothetical protein